MGIVFPAEGDLTIGEVDNPLVGDGDAVSVAGQVVQDMFGSAEWRFGVNDPVVTKQQPQESIEVLLFGQLFHSTGEYQFVLVESLLQTGDELAAKHAAQHL